MDISVFERLAAQAAEYRAKADEISEFLRLAKKLNLIDSTPGPSPVADMVGPTAARLLDIANKKMTIKERVLTSVESVLSDGKRRTSRELVPEVGKLGVHFSSKDPAGLLASYLSREKDRFTSDLKLGGWTLVRLAPHKARPADVGAPAGLFANDADRH